ncbi:putative secreted protein with PEP-CTERM sorting signal [Pseudoduganella lurida]|uniref:Putative secreted protein with PEP-CTERM sorting signal n=1 Tax=Pseudoduganella lurida TaxID=1036180 RepID=A0A562QV67_9BURK|nr:PEP-CTERM sorting domain-containing protein [Pseudoduganella lurida]TWI60728.1 putative secreted protein with PEP-CTERM sorting signal [Pseudoduganella lurida]
MKRIRCAALFALASAAALLACGAAHAGAAATASIGQVTLGAVDLTPGDGSTAGFSLATFDSRLIVYTDTRNTGGSFDRTIVTPPPFAAGAAHHAHPAAVADASTAATGTVAAQASTGAALGLDNMVSAESEQRLWLTLAPHTLLTVSGNVLTRASRTLEAGEGYRVFTWAAVDITDSDMVTTSYLTRESALIWGEATTFAQNAEYFALGFANPGDAAMNVSLNFLAYTDITVAAVPEPATYAMLTAGFGVLLLRRTRRDGNRHST